MENKTQLTITFTMNDLYNNMHLSPLLKVGNKVIVYDDTNDYTGRQSFGIMEDNGRGIQHISNFFNFEYHGYRGSYCGMSQHGHGLRKIEQIIYERKAHADTVVKVVLGPDLVPDKP